MRAVVQRAKNAQVIIDGEVLGKIERGLLVLVGIGADDNDQDIEYVVKKVIHLRIFPDEKGHFAQSVLDIRGEVLIVSQFTLFGDCRKGRRPSFSCAAPIDQAKEMYERLVERFKKEGIRVATGRFQAMMTVESANDGPVTLLIDSKKLF